MDKLDYSFNVHTLNGEDGIIQKILDTIPQKDTWCVEFGAFDGILESNTRNLILNKGYSAVLIEKNRKRVMQLQANYAKNDRVTAIYSHVGFRPDDNLDCLLKTTNIPHDFDFLSIDIDGNDYHVWKAFSEYKPKVVCIEFNETIPTEVRFVQLADSSVTQGASLLSLVDLALDKGYELVSVLSYNAFFVKSEYFRLFGIEDNSPAKLRKDLSKITYLFSGYDGRILLRGARLLPWSRVEIKESSVQVIPAILRKFPGNYGYARKLVFGLYLLFTNPRRLASVVCNRMPMVHKRMVTTDNKK